MMSRDTRTGGVLEAMILHALKRGGYEHLTQIKIGKRIGGGAHKVDVIAEKNSEKLLISSKWQQVSGTTEDKVPFEMICLAEAIRGGEFARAYIVLGGDGWKRKDFYVSGGLYKHLVGCEKVQILTLERFVALANQGKL